MPERTRLTRQRIVIAAVRTADKKGIDALSMRQIAADLGFGVMSLYNHVSDKDDLILAMVDSAASEIELTTKESQGWKVDLRALAISAYRTMLKHSWAPQVWGRSLPPAKNQYHETVLRIMREAGLPEELSCRGFHALTMHVVGFALQVLDMPFTSNQGMRRMGKQAMHDLPAHQFPYLREHIEFHLAGKDQRNDFKFMLDLILDGLERDFEVSEQNSK